MHRQELIAKTKEVNALTRLNEENRTKLISTKDSAGYGALVSVLGGEMGLLKETMAKYMSWDGNTLDSLLLSGADGVNSNDDAIRDREGEDATSEEATEVGVEPEPNEEGIITGAISIIVGDGTGGHQQHDRNSRVLGSSSGGDDNASSSSNNNSSSSRKENEELCQVLLSTLQKAINILEHDPYSDPDSAYMKQQKVLSQKVAKS